MDKLQRNERLAALLKILSDAPCRTFTLGHFTELFGSAKSTISEDIDTVREILQKMGMGVIESLSGATGGVRFIPSPDPARTAEVLCSLCTELSRKERVLPGGYLYMLDLIYDPVMVEPIARIFASHFYRKEAQYVLTVETKGIPLAFMTARYLNVPLVIVRHYSEAMDGPSVNINYVSGSSRKIQTMVLSLKALKHGSRLIFIDDFMKGGGTARGIVELAREFDCTVSGIGVLIGTAEPARKLVDDYFSLLTLYGVDSDTGGIDIKPYIKIEL